MTEDSEDTAQPVGTLWLKDLANAELGIGNAESALHSKFPIPNSAFHKVGSEAAVMLAEAMGFDDPVPVLERFDGGRQCYVVQLDGVVASYGWVSLVEEWVSELGLHIRLAPGDAYIWDCATLPIYRGQGLYPALLVYILDELRTEGLLRVWIGADTGSIASQKGIVKAGFQPIADFFPAPTGAAKCFFVKGRAGVAIELVRDAHDAMLFET